MKTTSKLSIGMALMSLAASAAWGLEGAFINSAGWVFEFESDGVLLVSLQAPSQDGLISQTARLNYESDGDRITITSPEFCNGETGVYTFEENDEGVTFTVVSDACSDRVAELADGLLKKVTED